MTLHAPDIAPDRKHAWAIKPETDAAGTTEDFGDQSVLLLGPEVVAEYFDASGSTTTLLLATNYPPTTGQWSDSRPSPYLHLDAPLEDYTSPVTVAVERRDHPIDIRAHWICLDPYFVPWFVLFGYGYHQCGTLIRDARVEHDCDCDETFEFPVINPLEIGQ